MKPGRFFQFVKNSGSKPLLGVASDCGSKYINLNLNPKYPNLLIDFIQKDFIKENIEADIKSLPIEEITDDMKLLQPLIKPPKVISLNVFQQKHNYKNGIFISNKCPNNLTGPMSNIRLPKDVISFKCRPELGLVIGKTARNVSTKNAMDHLFGYTAALNIIKCKITKENDTFWLKENAISQSSDSLCPIGPTVVHKSILTNPHDLKACLKINEKIISCENTSGLVCRIEDMIEFLSKHITLEPGDIILTGPPNVQSFLNRCDASSVRCDDLVECEIEEIGSLKNKVSLK